MNSILCLNTGSSTLKYAFFQGEKAVVTDSIDINREEVSLSRVFDAIPERPDAVAHRVVHGGDEYTEATLIDHNLLTGLEKLIRLAPDHLPRAIEVIEAARSRYSEIPHYACFDTAFHQRMPDLAKRFPLPQFLWDDKVRRYGFHGLSYESIIAALGDRVPSRLIVAHLGNGNSLCAIKDGNPVDTTMGLTPTGGVMMGTRSGDLDPGLILYLLREENRSADEIDQLVNHQSGLLGVSGLSSDMRVLLAEASRNESAALAIDLYCQGIRKAIGALAAVLGGLDLLVFTGGIGENATPVREQIVHGLEYLNADIEVIPTNEALSMVRQVLKYEAG